MKRVTSIFALLFIMVLGIYAFAQVASPVIPAPSAAPVPSGIAAWIHTQGGLVAAVGVIVACLNIVLSALAQLFSKLSMAEPQWLQVIGNVLLKITQYFSANTPTPAPQVQAALDQNKQASS